MATPRLGLVVDDKPTELSCTCTCTCKAYSTCIQHVYIVDTQILYMYMQLGLL